MTVTNLSRPPFPARQPRAEGDGIFPEDEYNGLLVSVQAEAHIVHAAMARLEFPVLPVCHLRNPHVEGLR